MITPTFIPSDKSNFPRSYITKLVLSDEPGPLSLVDNILTLTILVPFTYYHVFELLPEFIPWSSNVYSLSFLIQDYYYIVPPSPTHNPFGATVTFLADKDEGFFKIKIEVPGSSLVHQDVALAGAPGGYWLGPIPPL